MLGVGRRALMIAAVMAGSISLVLGANAALTKRSTEAPAASVGAPAIANKHPRVALVIGNSNYPDASAPLTQPVNDARLLTEALRADGFDIDLVENATRLDMSQAIDRLNAKVGPDSVVMLYYAGFGIQARRESYMIPVDAAIWSESDVRRDGTSIEAVLDQVKAQGAAARLVVLDASRRNPYERRFRTYSHGLAPLDLPQDTVILASRAAGKVADDSAAANSLLAIELVRHLDPHATVESVFVNTRNAVARASNGAQLPVVSSSLAADVRLGAPAPTKSAQAGN